MLDRSEGRQWTMSGEAEVRREGGTGDMDVDPWREGQPPAFVKFFSEAYLVPSLHARTHLLGIAGCSLLALCCSLGIQR